MTNQTEKMTNYINTIYSEGRRPLSDYPEKLVSKLINQYSLKKGSALLEVGCGRCEHLRLFKKYGLNVKGLDFSKDAIEKNPDIEILICNLEVDKIPLASNSIDIIYSKSFIEHLDSPVNFLMEARRVLKPNGIILTLVPDWESNMQIYFDDFSHKTPYTVYSLKDLYEMIGFGAINVSKFRQLPIVWKYPVLNYLCSVLAFFVPHRSNVKFLRWSKELMIIGSAIKVEK